MSDGDALLWQIEKDPQLRSTILVVWLLDRAPKRARFEDKIERATRTIPRLRQRVMSNPASLAPPRWEVDPSFDRKFHLRRIAAPGDGSLQAVAEAVASLGRLLSPAVNITLFSQRGTAYLGINSDPAAIADPACFAQCMADGFAEVLSTQP
jgi:hypothetical protein